MRTNAIHEVMQKLLENAANFPPGGSQDHRSVVVLTVQQNQSNVYNFGFVNRYFSVVYFSTRLSTG